MSPDTMSVLSSIDELYIQPYMHTIDGAGGAHGTVHYHLHSHTGIANGHRVPRRRPPPNHITFYVRFNAIVDCEDRKTKLKGSNCGPLVCAVTFARSVSSVRVIR